MKRSNAEIVQEYGPFPGAHRVHGVSYDGQHVWFASGDKLNAFNPASGKMMRSINVAAHAGTAFDGKHLFQIAEDRIQKIDPKTGSVLATIPAPGGGGDSGLAWAEGTLWVGEYRNRKIHQIDPETGAILRTIESNRFVTGVTWVDGELWHATWEGEESDLRRVDPRTGEVQERLEMPTGVYVSGLESDGGDQFFCGGGPSGKISAGDLLPLLLGNYPGSTLLWSSPPLACALVLSASRGFRLCLFPYHRKPSSQVPYESHASVLAAPRQRAMPEPADLEPKGGQRHAVGRHAVIADGSTYDRSEPFAHFRDRFMHAPFELGFDLAQLRLQSFADRLPQHRKPSVTPLLSTDMSKAEEVERFRLPLSALLSVFGRARSELQQTRFLRMQFQAELSHSLDQFCPEPCGVRFQLEPNHDIVCKPHDDHVAVG